ncbi:DUF2927 domain-containing protein [Paracoccus contaminans]|uniref:DUF2927 domain-containing protein n=1 Tax=Paracoccus contaminans TaxID=1945662 RepID=A0A1W6D1B3_9RHOB|nr:hypothetical protein B0A89_09145 [Paracoccus contaminans]
MLALAACAAPALPAPPLVPVPAPLARPVPASARPPHLSQAELRRRRAMAIGDSAPAARPSDASRTMGQYLKGIQDTLLARGLLRTDDGTAIPTTAARLVDDFVQIALRDEYQMTQGRLVPRVHSAPLRRWGVPVGISIVFGDSVPEAQRGRDRAAIADYAARLGRITGHPLRLKDEGGNLVVLVLNEDERRAIGPRLAGLVPGIPGPDMRAIENLAPQNYCTVFAYSSGTGASYTNAVAVIRAELPQPLRTSCFHEELAQALGLANDSPDARPSIFNDDEEFALLTRHDELLLKMLYDPRLRPGMTEAEALPIVQAIAAELAR